MGLFGKKEMCSVCNENEGNKKLLDGYVCKNCIKKVAPCFTTISWNNYTKDKFKNAIALSEENEILLKKFLPTKKIEKYISFDENNKLWKIHTYNVIFKYEDIISYELIEDGESITKGGLGGAVVGGALLGGTGVLAGSILGKKKTKKEIDELRVKIITRNEFYQVVFINFLIAGPVKSGSLVHKGYKAAADRIISELTVIMDLLDSTNRVSNSTPTPMSDADQIIKFKQLYDEGIITEEEFIAKKRQLLGI